MTPALQRSSWPTLTFWVTGETWSLWGSLWVRAKPGRCGLGQPGPSPPTPAGSSSAPWLWWPHSMGWGKGGDIQVGHGSCRGDRPVAQLVPKGAAVAPPAEVICGGLNSTGWGRWVLQGQRVDGCSKLSLSWARPRLSSASGWQAAGQLPAPEP